MDPWIACSSWSFINSALSSSLSSRKALIPASDNAAWRWPVKPLRVSSPLKLKNTWYFRVLEEEDGEDEEEAAFLASIN
ncbi:unnamed protein product [Prunus armeniaca]